MIELTEAEERKINFARRSSVTSASGEPHPGNDLLLEDGFYILLEDGVSTILLEQLWLTQKYPR